jgi:hypothetical protein
MLSYQPQIPVLYPCLAYVHALDGGQSWLDWLTRDTIRKFIYCEIDAKTWFMEKALQRGELQKLLA